MEIIITKPRLKLVSFEYMQYMICIGVLYYKLLPSLVFKDCSEKNQNNTVNSLGILVSVGFCDITPKSLPKHKMKDHD